MAHSRMFILLAVFIIFLFSGCSTTESNAEETEQGISVHDQSKGPNDQNNERNNLTVNGIVKSVSDEEMTISVNPMAMPDNNNGGGPGGPGKIAEGENNDDASINDLKNGDNPPDSEGNKDSGPHAGGNPPQDADLATVVPDDKPDGNENMLDTSDWEEASYRIDDQTVIVKLEMGDNETPVETEIAISDVGIGENVMITLRDDLTAIDKIVITDNQGIPPQNAAE